MADDYKGTIVLLEDSVDHLRAAAAALEETGYRVIAAKSFLHQPEVLQALGLRREDVPLESERALEFSQLGLKPVTNTWTYLVADPQYPPSPDTLLVSDNSLQGGDYGSELLRALQQNHRLGHPVHDPKRSIGISGSDTIASVNIHKSGHGVHAVEQWVKRLLPAVDAQFTAKAEAPHPPHLPADHRPPGVPRLSSGWSAGL